MCEYELVYNRKPNLAGVTDNASHNANKKLFFIICWLFYFNSVIKASSETELTFQQNLYTR